MTTRHSENRAASTPRLRWLDAAFQFCQQWRHAYLVLALILGGLWRIGANLAPELEHVRILGGLHPGDVFMLSRFLAATWLPPVCSAVLYVWSFQSKHLNTSGAVAIVALYSVAYLVLLAALALVSVHCRIIS